MTDQIGTSLSEDAAVQLEEIFGDQTLAPLEDHAPQGASRLVELAHPGTVVVDDDTASALFESDLRIKAMRPRKLKGLGFVSSWVVRAPGSWSDLVDGPVADG